MDELKTDEEKAEEIKAWWRENGLSVVIGVGLALVGVFGWQQWQSHQLQKSEEASALFLQIENTPTVVEKLQSDYASTPYASLAMLAKAKQSVEKGEDTVAIEALQWAIDNTSDTEVKDVAVQ